jgi:hypothetical protein
MCAATTSREKFVSTEGKGFASIELRKVLEKKALGLSRAFVQQFQHGAVEPALAIQCLIDSLADDEFFALGRQLDVEDVLK